SRFSGWPTFLPWPIVFIKGTTVSTSAVCPNCFLLQRKARARNQARNVMMVRWLLPFLGVALVPIPAPAGDAAAPKEARAILQAHCAACHGGGKAAKGGFGYVLDRDLLVSRLLVT